MSSQSRDWIWRLDALHLRARRVAALHRLVIISRILLALREPSGWTTSSQGTRMLRGGVALVTGGARGIGAAVARRLAHDGLRIVLTEFLDAEGRAAAAEISTKTEYRRLDVREEAEWASVTTAIIEEYGRLDVLVNNARIAGLESGAVPHDPEHATLGDWHAVHRTNLDGVSLGCKYGIRAMRETGSGSIINISSRSGLVGIPTAAAYASSKAVVRDHTTR